MPFGSGISAMIRAGAALELEPDVGLETISIGAPPNSLAGNYELETCGQHLAYRITITGQEIHVAASLADSIVEPEFLLRCADDETGWRLAFAFLCSMERYQVQDLTRPITVGNPLVHPPESCWVVA